MPAVRLKKSAPREKKMMTPRGSKKPRARCAKSAAALTLALYAVVSCGLVHAGTVSLKKAWVEKYKDRATINATFHIDEAHSKPNTAKKDGDLHIAGRTRQAGIPTVAEIMNAKDEPAALQEVRNKKGSSVRMVGAWRLWFEHPPKAGEMQTQNLNQLGPVLQGTNPDHVFEIHPVSEIAAIDLGDTFGTITGFKAKEAAQAFARYNKLTAAVRADTHGLTIDSPKAGYNYVEFWFEAKGKPKALKDGGRVVLADVYTATGDEPLAQDIRMIFVPGTKPFAKVSSLEAGSELHVLGIPRVNLNALYTFAYSPANTGERRPLPYEMIIVAVYQN
jgi:hypothetical protein